MRLTRKIVVIFEKEYFIEFNIWNHGATGKHCFFINLRNNITNPNVLNVRYSNFGNGCSFNGNSNQQYMQLCSKEVKRKFLNYITSGSNDLMELWLLKESL